MRAFITLTLLATQAFAQLIISAKPEKTEFIAHEDVNYILTISNRSGRSLDLHGTGKKNWLDFNVYDQSGDLLSYKTGIPIIKSTTIASGQTISKKITLSDHYDVSRHNRYKVVAFVKLPGDNDISTRSKYSSFLVTSGSPLFTQHIGLQNTNEARKYEVFSFSGNGETEIYLRITNEYTGGVHFCKSLSQYVPFRKPQASLDANNNLHILYLITPTLYIHQSISPTGEIIKRNYHKPGAVGEPRLVSFANGEVLVAGTIPFDPVKAEKEAKKQKKLSDRPNINY